MRSTLLAVALAMAPLIPTRSPGQQICDPTLKPAAGELYPYERRGDRCEGVYEIELSDTEELPVAGFMVPVQDLNFRSSRLVHVRWRGQAGTVRLRAASVRWRTYYRMDTAKHAANGLFTWPSLILGNLDVFGSEIAVLAWLDEGPVLRRVHLPVTVDTAARARRAGAYELVIVPTTDFARVHVTLRRVLTDGTLQLVGAPNVEIGEPSYDRDKEFRVPVPLTGTLTPGEYEIQLSGLRKTGGWVTPPPFRFRHGTAPL